MNLVKILLQQINNPKKTLVVIIVHLRIVVNNKDMKRIRFIHLV